MQFYHQHNLYYTYLFNGNSGNDYLERYLAYFTPVQSGLHTFYVSADDRGMLYVAEDNNISSLNLYDCEYT